MWGRLSVCATKAGLLGNDLEIKLGLDGLVDLGASLVCTELLDLVGENGDVLLVELDTGGLESLGELGGSDRTIDRTVLADLDGELEGGSGNLGGERLGIGDELSLFVSTLTKGLFVLLLHGRSRNGGESLRDQVIKGITSLNLHNLTGIAEIVDIFLKQNFHKADYLRRSVT